MATVLVLLFAGGAVAFDFGQVKDAPPEVIQCLKDKLEPSDFDQAMSGRRSGDKMTRRAIKKAYERCARATTQAQGVSPYEGPLFDAMSQIDETVDMDKAMERVRNAGVAKLALFARSRKRLHQNEQAVLELAKRNPDLIILGAPKYFKLSGDVSSDYIQATVEGVQKHGYRFIGELLYTHGDKATGKKYASGERYVDPSRPGTAKLLKALVPFEIPFMAHWEPYRPERDFPRFHKLYAAWPEQIFILPHMGFASPDQLETFMDRHPNLYLLTSKKERYMDDFHDPRKQEMIGTAMLDGLVLRPEWKDLLVRYQDRILFATDPHMEKLWRRYEHVVSDQRLILGQLPRDAAEKIAYKNAEKMYGVSIHDK